MKTETATIPFLPIKTNKLEMVFGEIKGRLPKWSEIPEQYKRSSHPCCAEISRIFFKGGNISHWKERDGINRVEAINHIKSILTSWEPKHEHKEAGCAYLLDLWFTLGKTKE